MKLSLFTLLIITMFATLPLSSQKISYQVKEANVDKYRGFLMPEIGTHIGGGSLLGFDLGLHSQYRLPVFPLTLRGMARWEFAGLGRADPGRTRLLDAGAMLPIIPGRAKSGQVKVTTDYHYSSSYTEEHYFYVDGQIKKSLLARGGLYHLWTTEGLATTGFSAGLGFNVTEHALVEVNDGGFYETFHNWQLFLDALIAPIAKNEELLQSPLPIGGRVGVLSTGANWDWYGEISVYPKGPPFLLFGFLFDVGAVFK